MSSYSCRSPSEKFCSRNVKSFYLVGGLNNSLKVTGSLGLVNVLKFFILIEILEMQLFFNIQSLPSIALKSQNFPDNLDFKGKIVAKFLLKSHFPLIYKNMTIKQQIRKITKIKNYGIRENKSFYIYGCFSVSRHIKKGRNSHLRTSQSHFQTRMYV